jgi:hypothetical protein
MKKNPLKQSGILEQLFWLDYIGRDLIKDGELRHLIEDDGLRGMTSNPSNFEKVIVENHIYYEDTRDMALKKRDVKEMVNPHSAHDTKDTIEEARRLWIALERTNVSIKVPATSEAPSAIRQLISKWIDVNVTLFCGLPRYWQVAEAYIVGLEDRAAQRKPVKHKFFTAYYAGKPDSSCLQSRLPSVHRDITAQSSIKHSKNGTSLPSVRLIVSPEKSRKSTVLCLLGWTHMRFPYRPLPARSKCWQNSHINRSKLPGCRVKNQSILTSAPGNGGPIGGLKVIVDSGWFAVRPSGIGNFCETYGKLSGSGSSTPYHGGCTDNC